MKKSLSKSNLLSVLSLVSAISCGFLPVTVQAEKVLLSENTWFPQVRSQVGGTCTVWAGVYNQYGAIVANAYGWDAAGPDDSTKMAVYNIWQPWSNEGVFSRNHMRHLAEFGCATWDVCPTKSAVNQKGVDSALLQKHVAFEARELGHIQGSQENLDRLKSLLRQQITISFVGAGPSDDSKVILLKDNPNSSDDDAYVGELVKSQGIKGTSHMMCFTGFNDDLWTDFNNNDQIDEGELGAIQFVNSWGMSWGNDGFMWVPYKFFLNSTACWPTAVTAETSYAPIWYIHPNPEATTPKPPRLVAHIEVASVDAGAIGFKLGTSSSSEQTPQQTKDFTIHRDEHGMTSWYQNPRNEWMSVFGKNMNTVRLKIPFDLADMVDSIDISTTSFYAIVEDLVPGDSVPVELLSFAIEDTTTGLFLKNPTSFSTDTADPMVSSITQEMVSSVTGRVTDASSGLPIANAKVYSSASSFTRTDSDGNFSFQTTSSATIFATAENYYGTAPLGLDITEDISGLEIQMHAGTTPVDSDGDGFIEINTVADLKWLGNSSLFTPSVSEFVKLQGNYELTADIDMLGVSDFDPIGDGSTAFTGSFAGNGYTISNLTIDLPTESCVALFAHANGASISDLTLGNCAISANSIVAGILAKVTSSSTTTFTSLSNCSVSGSITSVGGGSVGGIGAQYTRANLENCSSAAAVNSASWNAGGLVGWQDIGTVTGSFATGDVSFSGSQAGGFYGYAKSVQFTDCYSAGTLSGSGDHTGGFVGYFNDSHASNCYATGVNAVTGSNAAGFVGYIRGTGNFSYCYSTVTAEDAAFVGFVKTGPATIQNCAWYTGGPGAGSNSIGLGDVSNIAFADLDLMKISGNYTGWDFGPKTEGNGGYYWSIDPSVNNGYPVYQFHLERLEDKVALEINTDGSIKLSFEVEAGRSYCVEYSSDMVNWSACGTTIPVSQTATQITVTDDGEHTDPHPSAAAQRFYRLVEITEP